MPESSCPACGVEISPAVLSCPACHALIHAAELEALVQRARELEQTGDRAGSLELWRQALALLPPESKQAQTIQDHIASLSPERTTPPPEQPHPSWFKRLGPVGVAFAFLWKFKAVMFAFGAKAKFLLLGLGKLKMLLSMFVSFAVYWTMFGWPFALGFLIGIYVHEMGHVWALRRLGLRASAPMFIPGFGAFISLYDSPANESQDAYIGLAGPLWGAAAALAFVVPALVASAPIWLALARATASINLFNLTPVWMLDGGRGFRALDRNQRIYLLVLAVLLWWGTRDGTFFLITLGALYRIFWKKDHAPAPDQQAFLYFAGLLLFFGAMLALIAMPQMPE